MDFNSFDISKMKRAVNESHQQIAEEAKAKAEYQAALETAIFETPEILSKMQEESAKESQLNTRRFIIQTVVSVAALIAAIIAAVATVIPLL